MVSSATPVRGSPTSWCTIAGAVAAAASNGGPVSSSSLSTAASLLSAAALARRGRRHAAAVHCAPAAVLPPQSAAARQPSLPNRQRPLANVSKNRTLCMRRSPARYMASYAVRLTAAAEDRQLRAVSAPLIELIEVLRSLKSVKLHLQREAQTHTRVGRSSLVCTVLTRAVSHTFDSTCAQVTCEHACKPLLRSNDQQAHQGARSQAVRQPGRQSLDSERKHRPIHVHAHELARPFIPLLPAVCTPDWRKWEQTCAT